MSWVTLTILAALAWSISNVVDKYVLSKFTSNPYLPLIILGLIGLIGSGVVYLRFGFDSLTLWNTFLALLAGVLYFIAVAFYYFAVKAEEISRIVPLFTLTPLLVAILAAVFLGELFSPMKYLGIGFLIVGAVLISSKGKVNFRFGKGFWFIIGSVLVFAVQIVLSKHLLNLADVWTVFAYARIGTAIIVVPVAFMNFSDLRKMIKRHGQKSFWMISGSEVLNIVGIALITVATAVGFATLVTALSDVQALFVLLFTVVLSLFFPKILKEELSGKIVLQKLVAIILMIVGVVLIS